MLRQPLLKDNGNYTIIATSGSQTAQFSFTLKMKGMTERWTNRPTDGQTDIAFLFQRPPQ